MDNRANATKISSSSSIPWCLRLPHHPAGSGARICGMPTAHRAKAVDEGAQHSRKEPSDPKKSWEEHPNAPSLPADSSAALRTRRRLAFPSCSPAGKFLHAALPAVSAAPQR